MNATHAQAPLRLTVRGRRLMAAAVIVPALFGMGALVASPALAAVSASEQAAVELETVTVGPGQSLWDIASEIAEQRDVRDLMVEISALNGLTGSQLEAGQRLVLPSER